MTVFPHGRGLFGCIQIYEKFKNIYALMLEKIVLGAFFVSINCKCLNRKARNSAGLWFNNLRY